MQARTNVDAAYCYQRAEEASRMAERWSDPAAREDFERVEAHWVTLARNCDFSASLNTFLHVN